MGLSTFINLCRLARLELHGFCLAGIVGALCLGVPLSPQEVVVLFIATQWTVSLGFIHNDLCDLEVDRKHADLVGRPLVDGTVSLTTARWMTGILFILNLIVYGLFFKNLTALLFLAIAQILALAYNFWSKKLPGVDVLYASSSALLTLSAAVAINGGLLSHKLPEFFWFFLGFGWCESLYFNLVAGGLKDVKHDHDAGVFNLPRFALNENDGEIKVSVFFTALALGIRASSIALLMMGLLSMDAPTKGIQVGILAVVGAACLFFNFRLLVSDLSDRGRLLSVIPLQDGLSKLMIPCGLFHLVGFSGVLVFFLFPFAWFICGNKLLHGSFNKPPSLY